MFFVSKMASPTKRTLYSASSDDAQHVPPKKRYRHIAEEERLSKHDDDVSDSERSISVDEEKETKTEKPGRAWQMMAKMGYKHGGGLGAQNQGRSELIDVKMRPGRRGLGAEVKGLEPSLDIKWDEDQEEISVEEIPEWIPECSYDVPTAAELDGWIKTGPKRRVIDDETQFCDADALSDMLQAKSVFDELSDRDLRNARTRANPFETIKGAFFQNRAAMKMANLDTVFDDLFTNPKSSGGKHWIPKESNNLFYFADVCAGPGGFTEYVLWRRGWTGHGFGMTLRGKDDFRLDDFLAAAPEMFEPFYGKNGLEGDGDITKPENLEAFKDFVLKATGGGGVHTVMADGGFSVEGQENIQEILSQRLYLCQILCAINILRPGGSFVCKLFDVFTPFSVGLLYLMWRAFDQISLHKPHTSRPANSERYIICKGLRDDVDAVRAHLTNANLAYETLAKERSSEEDVIELVPLDVLKNEDAFFTYVRESNNKLAKRQTLYLHKYKAYARNPMLQDTRQEDLRARCMRYWKVPDMKRPPAPRPNPNQKMEELCGNYSWISSGPPGPFDLELLDSTSEQEYRVMLRTGKPNIFLALGKRFIFRYEGTRWESVDQAKLCIPRDTVLFAELTSGYRGEGRGQMPMPMLRVFDAFCLGGENVADKAFRERRRLLTKFCLAIHKSSRPDLIPVYVADVWHIEYLPQLRNKFFMGKVRGGSKAMFHGQELCNGVVQVEADLPAQGFIVVRVIRDEWKLAFSRRENRLYFFNTKTGESIFEAREDAFSGFISMYASRKIWPDPKRKRQNSEDDSEKRRIDPEEELLLDMLKLMDSAESRKAASSCSRLDS